MNVDHVRKAVEQLVVSSSDGSLSPDELASVNWSLVKAGYSSLSYMTVLAGLEQNFGITIDPYEEPTFLESVETITAYVCDQLSLDK